MENYIRLGVQSRGLQAQRSSHSIVCMMHLYHYMKLCLPTTMITWPDMELIMSVQSSQGLFMGALPKKSSESRRRLCLAAGLSIQNYAPNQRSDHRPRFQQLRTIYDRTALAETFWARMSSSTAETVPYLPRLGKLLASDDHSSVFDRQIKQLFGDEDKAKVVQGYYASLKDDADPLKVLEKLRLSLIGEAGEMEIDWYRLACRCARLWAKIYPIVAMDGYDVEALGAPGLAMNILWAGTLGDSRRLSAFEKVARERYDPQRFLHVFETMMERGEGDKEVRRVREVGKGIHEAAVTPYTYIKQKIDVAPVPGQEEDNGKKNAKGKGRK